MLHNKMSLLIAVFFNEAAEKGESVVLEVKNNAMCDFYSFPAGQTGLANQRIESSSSTKYHI